MTASKVYSTTSWAWEYTHRYQNDGQAWVEILNGTEDDAVVLTSAFNEDTYMGKGTILQRPASSMPVDPMTPTYQEFMDYVTPFRWGSGFGSKTSLNTTAFGTHPIHMYVVDSHHPESNFREFAGVFVAGGSAATTNHYLNGPVPLPSWGVPAQNQDRGLAVYDKGTGIMREYFMVTSTTSNAAVWKSTGAGYSVNTPGLNNLATDNYALQQEVGRSNIAGMHNSLGFIGIAEALNRKINHALCFTVASLRMTNDDGSYRSSWPSRGADGKLERYMPGGDLVKPTGPYDGPIYSPAHGQWGRLPMDIDFNHNPRTGAPYPLFCQLVMKAAQQYGLVATDTNLFVHAFNTEQGTTFKHAYGVDPWTTGGVIDEIYKGPVGDGGGLQGIREFPWHLVEWAPMDWGRPNPDMNLHPGQLMPWRG